MDDTRTKLLKLALVCTLCIGLVSLVVIVIQSLSS